MSEIRSQMHGATRFTSRIAQSPKLMEMLARVPEYSAASRVLMQIEGALPSLAEKVREAELDALGDDLYETGEIPTGYFNDLAARVRAAADAKAAHAQAETMRVDAAGRMEYAAEQGADVMLAELNRDLQDLMAQVTEIVGRLGGATTATSAMDRGTAVDWAEVRALRDRYESLREAQSKIWQAGRFEPSYYDARKSNKSDANSGDSLLFYADNLQHRVPECDVDELLVWCVRNGVHVWIPTQAQAVAMRRAVIEHSALNGVAATARRNDNHDRFIALTKQADEEYRAAVARVIGVTASVDDDQDEDGDDDDE